MKAGRAWALVAVAAGAAGLAVTFGLAAGPAAVTPTALRLPQRSVTMPGFGREERLGPSEIADLTEYVLALSTRSTDEAAVLRAIPLYERNCAACHGDAGQGDPALGVPDLTDDVWVNGASRDEIHAQIWRGDDGRGPLRLAE